MTFLGDYGDPVVEEYKARLELDEFPAPSSMRFTTLGSSFTTFGLERGRLFQMYRTGADTAAIMLLLLHAAARSGSSGTDQVVMPYWCIQDDKDTLENDLQLIGQSMERHTFTLDEVRAFA